MVWIATENSVHRVALETVWIAVVVGSEYACTVFKSIIGRDEEASPVFITGWTVYFLSISEGSTTSMLNNTHPPETTILPVILTHIVPLQNIIKSQQSSDSATVWRSWLKKRGWWFSTQDSFHLHVIQHLWLKRKTMKQCLFFLFIYSVETMIPLLWGASDFAIESNLATSKE